MRQNLGDALCATNNVLNQDHLAATFICSPLQIIKGDTVQVLPKSTVKNL